MSTIEERLEALERHVVRLYDEATVRRLAEAERKVAEALRKIDVLERALLAYREQLAA